VLACKSSNEALQIWLEAVDERSDAEEAEEVQAAKVANALHCHAK
jgi:hypothetical protein